MEGAAVSGRLGIQSQRGGRPLAWQLATVTAIRQETPTVKTFTLALPDWMPHRAGQHYDVRLTAPDGYQAQRSYSVASEPERTGEVDLTVEQLEDGEVSSYLHDVVVPGDLLELRGPVGGYFVWEPDMGGPLLLVAGGSGVVPLMGMIRHRAAAGSHVPARMLYSVRTPEDAIYADELKQLSQADSLLDVVYTFTRTQPKGWGGYARRIDQRMLDEVIATLEQIPLVYVCGPTLMVERVAGDLVETGIPAERIRTERFGPTG
jgi:ferredoxin-NADP reductase